MEGALVVESGAKGALCGEGSTVQALQSAEFSPGRAVEVALVPVSVVRELWSSIEEWITAALEQAPVRTTSTHQVLERLAAGEYRLLLARSGGQVRAAVVLERLERWLFVVAAGGREQDSLEAVGPELWRAVLETARGLELDGVRMVGRPGWARWLTRWGGAPVRLRVMQVLIEARG